MAAAWRTWRRRRTRAAGGAAARRPPAAAATRAASCPATAAQTPVGPGTHYPLPDTSSIPNLQPCFVIIALTEWHLMTSKVISSGSVARDIMQRMFETLFRETNGII